MIISRDYFVKMPGLGAWELGEFGTMIEALLPEEDAAFGIDERKRFNACVEKMLRVFYVSMSATFPTGSFGSVTMFVSGFKSQPAGFLLGQRQFPSMPSPGLRFDVMNPAFTDAMEITHAFYDGYMVQDTTLGDARERMRKHEASSGTFYVKPEHLEKTMAML